MRTQKWLLGGRTSNTDEVTTKDYTQLIHVSEQQSINKVLFDYRIDIC